eukprot:754890-Hanusia_phi.AAC.11
MGRATVLQTLETADGNDGKFRSPFDICERRADSLHDPIGGVARSRSSPWRDHQVKSRIDRSAHKMLARKARPKRRQVSFPSLAQCASPTGPQLVSAASSALEHRMPEAYKLYQ